MHSNLAVAFRNLSEDERRTVELYDTKLAQEAIYRQLLRLEPRNDILPRMDMFPGHNEYRGQRRNEITKPQREHSYRSTDTKTRQHRPWRDLQTCWPENRKIVEIQIRGGNTNGSNRILGCYHIDRQWYDKNGNRLGCRVERWRMMPLES